MRTTIIELDSIKAALPEELKPLTEFLLERLTLRVIQETKPEAIILVASTPQHWHSSVTTQDSILTKTPNLANIDGWFNVLCCDAPLLEMQITRWSSLYHPTDDFCDIERVKLSDLETSWGGSLSWVQDVLSLEQAGLTRAQAKNLLARTSGIENALRLLNEDEKKITYRNERTALKKVQQYRAPLVTLSPHRGLLTLLGGHSVLYPVRSRVVKLLDDIRMRTYTLIVEEQGLKDFVKRLEKADRISLDTETTGVDSKIARLVGISIGLSSRDAVYIDVDSVGISTITKYLRPALRNKKIIMHNAKYDLEILERYGIVIVIDNLDDTMIMAYLLGKDRVGLKIRAQQDLKVDMIHIEDLIDEELDMSMVPINVAAEYAAGDAHQTYGLWELYSKEFQPGTKFYNLYRVEIQVINILRQMERDGMAIDSTKFKSLEKEAEKSLIKLETDIYDEAGFTFNIESTQELGDAMFTKLGIRVGKSTKTGRPSTDKLTLTELVDEHPIVEKIIEYRTLSKLKSTFISKLPEVINPVTHKIHTSWLQTSVITGRLSSRDPNLQNIPSDRTPLGMAIRKAFITNKPNYVLVGADFSQLEIRVMAHFSQDEGLIAGYINEGKEEFDVHRYIASKLYNKTEAEVTKKERSLAKATTFGIMYGLSEHGLSKREKITLEEASKFIKMYFDTFPGIKNFIEDAKQFARRYTYTETLLGRRRYFQYINSEVLMARNAAEREAVNMIIQGTASDIVKLSMHNLFYDYLPKECRTASILLQIHDELLCEVHENEADTLVEVMEYAMPSVVKLRVPLRVEAKKGHTWGDVH